MINRAIFLSQTLVVTLLLTACSTLPFVQDLSDAILPGPVAESEPAVDGNVSEAQIREEAAAPDETDPVAGPGSRETEVAVPVFFPGSGEFINPVVGTWQPLKISVEGDVTLNFVDADLREVIRAILGDALRANYVIDPRV